MNYLQRLLLISLMSFSSTVLPIIDNRYFPFYPQRLPRHFCRFSGFNSNFFVMQGTIARDCDDLMLDDVEVPRLLGQYDFAGLNRSMDDVGIDNTLYLDEWIPAVRYSNFVMNGTLQAIGASFWYEQAFGSCALLGIQTGLSYVSSSQTIKNSMGEGSTVDTYEIINRAGELFEGRGNEVDQARLNANRLLGIEESLWSKFSPLDTTIYARLSNWHEYCLKCRYASYGLTVGGIIPAAARRNPALSASLPVGGDGHPGLLVRLDGLLELKEDIFFGLNIDFVHRLPTTKCRRIPVGREQPVWGVQTGKARVAPGITVGVNPYLAVEDYVDGWGAYLQYFMVYHARDSWRDERKDPDAVADFALLEKNSFWKSEYVSVGVTFDPAKALMNCTFLPRFYFDMNIPVHFLGGRGAVKTYRYSLGFEFNF